MDLIWTNRETRCKETLFKNGFILTKQGLLYEVFSYEDPNANPVLTTDYIEDTLSILP